MLGWPEDGLLWRHQLAPLIDVGYRILIPDIFGFGQSSRPTELERYHSASLAPDMVQLLDYLSINTTHVIAHDYGAVTEWYMVLFHLSRG
ncbi:MAG: alpha/beta hydrolase [Cyanothece sp. SIO1E1]|nr:alpha/beta hydrolase [Cyanothece sp. SIO1E1]